MMNFISSYKLLLIVTLAIDCSNQIKWLTEPRTVNVCKGNDLNLVWKFDEEENEISKLEWYFKGDLICTYSVAENFVVSPPYQDRIERLGKTEIRLKNISLEDGGTFKLFPVLRWSTDQNTQDISLEVLEPPTKKCMRNVSSVGYPTKLTCQLSTSDCGRPLVSVIWKRKETNEVLGEGNYFSVSSSFQDSEILCCLNGTAMKCIDDPAQYCTSVRIPQVNYDTISKSENILQTASGLTPVHNHDDTGSTNLFYILLVTILPVLIVIIILLILIYRKMGSRNTMLGNFIEMRTTHVETERISPEGERGEHTEINLEQGDEVTEDTSLCKVCLKNATRITLVPCGHRVTCLDCAKTVKHCPSCKKTKKAQIDNYAESEDECSTPDKLPAEQESIVHRRVNDSSTPSKLPVPDIKKADHESKKSKNDSKKSKPRQDETSKQKFE